MSRINKPGNIFAKDTTLLGRHDAGVIYDTSNQKVGQYKAGSVGCEPVPAAAYGTYKDGVIYNSYGGKMGGYKDGRIYDENNKQNGSYTGDEDGGAAGAFVLICNA